MDNLTKEDKQIIIEECINLISYLSTEDIDNRLSYIDSNFLILATLPNNIQFKLYKEYKRKMLRKRSFFNVIISCDNVNLFEFEINKIQFENIKKCVVNIFNREREILISRTFKNYTRTKALNEILD